MLKKHKILVLSHLFVLFSFVLFSCSSAPKNNKLGFCLEVQPSKENQPSKDNPSSNEELSKGSSKNTSKTVSKSDLPEGVSDIQSDFANAKRQKNDYLNNNEQKSDEDEITLLFGGDIMAHSVNYQISSYEKIWRDVKYLLDNNDFVFGNLEAPVDTTKAASSYPNFNMTRKYVMAAVDAGFNVLSLCNNHTNDQGLSGILQTEVTMKSIKDEKNQAGEEFYYSGLKQKDGNFSFNIIEKNEWKILFLPVTELLNRPDYSEYINFIKTDDNSRKKFIDYVKSLKENNQCTLFILSLHTSEPEYTRNVTERQEKFYKDLLSAGVDIIWANHAHIIKNRKIIVNTKNENDKLIMYANGNTISGQRRNPDLTSKNPNGERDNTGDGLLYRVILKKEDNGSVKIKKCEPIFITTYINTAYEFVIKPLNDSFVQYLYDVPRTNWAKYIERRIKINYEATKDLIEWQ